MSQFLFIFALEAEAKSIIKNLKNKKKVLIGKTFYYKGFIAEKKILLIITGMGKENIINHIQSIVNIENIDLFISMGISGALNKDYKCGDSFEQNEITYNNKSYQLSIRLSDINENLSNSIKQARGLTVDRIIEDPKEKLKLNADIIDMETYHILELSKELNKPLLSLRTVLDEYDEQLPPFSIFTDSFGNIKIKAFIIELIKNPALIITLINIAGRMKKIQDQFYNIASKLVK